MIPNTVRQRRSSNAAHEFAFVLLKPLALQSRVQEHIVNTLALKGVIAQDTIVRADRRTLESHYGSVKKDKDCPRHLPALLQYLAGKQLRALTLRPHTGPHTKAASGGFISNLREEIIGPSHPARARPHHLRSLARNFRYKVSVAVPESHQVPSYQPFAIDNLVHCSDSPFAAVREAALWLGPRHALSCVQTIAAPRSAE